MVGDPTGVGRLVVGGVVEGDGKGLHLGGVLRLHQGHHQRRVDAAGEKRPQGHIGVHAGTNGFTQHRVELVEHGLLGLVESGSGSVLGHGTQRPERHGVGQRSRHRARLDRHHRPRGKLGDASVCAVRGGHAVVPEVQGESVPVELGGEGRVSSQGLELRTEEQDAAHPTVIERFLAEPVTGQVQPPLFSVPHGQGEHPVAAHQRLVHPPALHGAHEDLGVRRAAEALRRRSRARAAGRGSCRSRRCT